MILLSKLCLLSGPMGLGGRKEWMSVGRYLQAVVWLARLAMPSQSWLQMVACVLRRLERSCVLTNGFGEGKDGSGGMSEGKPGGVGDVTVDWARMGVTVGK